VRVFLSAILVLFVCIFPLKSEANILLDRVVAVVNNEVITWSELHRMMESEISPQAAKLNQSQRERLFGENENSFLEKLIDVRLQLQEAKKLGFEVTSGEVAEAVDNIRKKYSMTDETLKQSIEKEGLSFEEYKKRLSEQILLSRLVNQKIKNKVVVTDDEVSGQAEERKAEMGEDAYRISQIF
jgi:peptidyl-prolyl cis-trans isomerase SurA